MKKKPRIGRWVLLGVVAVGLYFFIAGDYGIIQLLRVRTQLHDSDQQIRDLTVTVDSLKVVVNKLSRDTTYIERIAREKLGMAKPTERVYKFVGKGK